jgi:hypothetical protein
MPPPVVGLAAWCDLETEDEARARLAADAPDAEPVSGLFRPGRYVPVPGVPVLSPGSLAFRVAEFAVLADGRRLRLHAERGFALSAGADPWAYLTLADLESSVLATVVPDDAEETGEDHPWERLADLLRRHGIETTPGELRRVPYAVEFSERLRARF